MNADITFNFKDNIEGIAKQDWNNLISTQCPFVQYDFFVALEKSQSASNKQGWTPNHLIASVNNNIKAIMPLYLKSHSWGEYVFDWDWADAFQRCGRDYYPKLVATVPFTPVSNEKVFSANIKVEELFPVLTEYCEQTGVSSWHVLYCNEITTTLPEDVYQRNTVQFHWFNNNYLSFSDYLNTFTSRKRKNTRKERLSITKQNIKVRQLKNEDITVKDLEFFYLTYQLTYLKRGHQPHLSYAFFQQIVNTMSNNLLLLIASDEEEDVACALFFYDELQLYGRYWGCVKHYTNLHFELCYYLGIEFCINNNLQRFNPGTQGEHKIQRGFQPVLTHSYHWVNHPEFKGPIRDFCLKEQSHMRIYQQQCRKNLPFKNLHQVVDE